MKGFGLFSLLLATPMLAAAEGSLDPQYGSNGLVAIDTSSLGNTSAGGTIGARGPSGSTYIISALSLDPQSEATQMVISRRGYHGALDTSFGNNGFAVTALPTSQKLFPQAAIPTADGGLVVAATFFDGQSTLEARICRFKPDGTADIDFGGQQTGCQSLSIPAATAQVVEKPEDRQMALALLPLGRLVVAATVRPSPNAASQVMLTVLDASGAIDIGFGNLGTVTLANFNLDHSAHGVATDANGNIAVATSLLVNGQDLNFGYYLDANGAVQWMQGGTPKTIYTAAAFLPNGSVVFGGMTDTAVLPLTGQYEGLLEHYTNDGQSIPTPFAPNGRFTLCDVCTSQKVSDIDAQFDGSVLLTGPHQQNFDTNDNPYVVKLFGDLSADTNFGISAPGISLLSFDTLGGNPVDTTARIYPAKGHIFLVGQHGPWTKEDPGAIPVIARLISSDVIFQDGAELFD